jgi:SPASM domain peptide maturase of grasp-with-spasm system
MFPDCIPVKGASRSIIYDLSRNSAVFITNDLFDLICNGLVPAFDDLKNNYDEEDQQTLYEYYIFLLEHEFIFPEQKNLEFNRIDFNLNKEFFVNNVIIDFNSDDFPVWFDKFCLEVRALSVEHIQFRLFHKASISFISKLLEPLKDSEIHSIEIITRFNDSCKDDYLNVFQFNNRLMNFVIFDCINRDFYENKKGLNNRIHFISENIIDENCCGVISYNFFKVNHDLFSHSLNVNSCLHGKISIDKEGFVKNCPTSNISFGHYNETSFKQVLLDSNFYKLTSIKKDEIETCKDCEFRYMCSDCRIIVKDRENQYSKPAKCSYDPYVMEWS